MWIDINGYEGFYQINEIGQVKRLGNCKWSKGSKDRILKQEKNNNGYLRVTLSKNNNVKRYLVHKLVYENFVCKINENMTINHKDLNRCNNNLNNLELVTQHENNQLKSNNKLDKSKIIMIRNSKLKKEELAKLFNVHIRTIERVISKGRWANV